jgi:hypothetical protein
MQLEYGTADAMSPQQRERHERLRNQSIREVLGAKRYESYLLTKDPLYRQAQLMAHQYGAPATVVPSIFQMNKSHESRRQQVMGDASMTPQQKQQLIQQIYQEQQAAIRKMATDAAQNR